MMKKMAFKIHILFKFIEGPWGGGNQFLKALREYFRKERVYAENPKDADVLLFNSHHCLEEVFKVKKKYANKILIHRVDGPISYVRGKDKIIDEIIFQFNNLVADGTIFQSNWCKKNNCDIGMKQSKYETVIMNVPDTSLFNSEGKKPFDKKNIRLIATSWSANIRKGFNVYKFLDEHLNFNKYEMTFVGNSPIKFKNVKWIKPVPTKEIAKILKEHDIFLTASRNDPCSNSLIEALHCGLPTVARNDGGHPEITGKAGEFFEDEGDIIDAIEKIVENYDYYQRQINVSTFDEIGHRYYEFARRIYEDYLNHNYYPKQIGFLNAIKFNIKMLKQKALNKIQTYIGI